jgi:hypothetical protein
LVRKTIASKLKNPPITLFKASNIFILRLGVL